jgi:hypothetical protein
MYNLLLFGAFFGLFSSSFEAKLKLRRLLLEVLLRLYDDIALQKSPPNNGLFEIYYA